MATPGAYGERPFGLHEVKILESGGGLHSLEAERLLVFRPIYDSGMLFPQSSLVPSFFITVIFTLLRSTNFIPHYTMPFFKEHISFFHPMNAN